MDVTAGSVEPHVLDEGLCRRVTESLPPFPDLELDRAALFA